MIVETYRILSSVGLIFEVILLRFKYPGKVLETATGSTAATAAATTTVTAATAPAAKIAATPAETVAISKYRKIYHDCDKRQQ